MAASREPRSAADSNWRGASPACAACSFATLVAKLDISRVSLGVSYLYKLYSTPG